MFVPLLTALNKWGPRKFPLLNLKGHVSNIRIGDSMVYMKT